MGITSNPYRLLSIDLLRIFLACIVCILHFDWHFIPQGYLAVEIFFILSGFFFSKKDFNSTKQNNFILYFTKRIKTIYYWYILACICYIIFIYKNFSLHIILNALLLWPQIGISQAWGCGSWWFIGVYIYVYILYLGLFYSLNKQLSIFITGIIVFLSIGILYHQTPVHCLNFTNELFLFGMSFGMLRGFLAFGIGILLGVININIPQKQAISISILFILLILYIMTHNVSPVYDFLIYPISCIGIIHLYNIKLKHKLYIINNISIIMYLFHIIIIQLMSSNIKSFFNKYIILYLAFIIFISLAITTLNTLAKFLLYKIKLIKIQ